MSSRFWEGSALGQQPGQFGRSHLSHAIMIGMGALAMFGAKWQKTRTQVGLIFFKPAQ
ncbi:MAG TPA: hypothetical protein VMT67_16665 [Terriglobales bacterium]|nr:hypothetical protein [Terriglobales bacterium]